MRSLCEAYVHLYLAECFLKLAFFRQKSVERIKTHILWPTFFRKSCCLWDNVENSTAGDATDDKIILRMSVGY